MIRYFAKFLLLTDDNAHDTATRHIGAGATAVPVYPGVGVGGGDTPPPRALISAHASHARKQQLLLQSIVSAAYGLLFHSQFLTANVKTR